MQGQVLHKTTVYNILHVLHNCFHEFHPPPFLCCLDNKGPVLFSDQTQPRVICGSLPR